MLLLLLSLCNRLVRKALKNNIPFSHLLLDSGSDETFLVYRWDLILLTRISVVTSPFWVWGPLGLASMELPVFFLNRRIWKSFWVQNSTRLLHLPIPSSAETWKIFTNKLCQFFFTEADILSEKNPNKNWLRVQDFVYKTLRLVRISVLISTITNSFWVFSR